MERLWAPWRREYVEKGGQEPGCIFCELPAPGSEADRERLVVARSDASFVMVNKFPYTSGHVMVVPFRHAGALEDLSREELADLSLLLQRAVAAVRQGYRPDGMNVGMNLGRSAGAGVPEHLHWHVVPRWNGDTNFMTSVGGVRVVIEEPARTRDRLQPLFTAVANEAPAESRSP